MAAFTPNSNHRPGDDNRVNWGIEVIRVFGIIGKIILRILSYIMNVLLTILLIGLITGIIVGSVFAIYINNYLDLTLDPTLLQHSGSGTTTTRFYIVEFDSMEDRANRIGNAVEWEAERIYGTENSIWVSYEDLPEDLINAFVAIEDHRFWKHNGVDWITTSKAVFYYFTGNSVAGGSTITQQLIKNLTMEDDVKIQRKVEEIFRALNLEKDLSKEQILEMYLNIVNLGNGARGVQAAANLYFDKDVSELTMVQCAALASIVKNPSAYEPLYHEEDRVLENGDIRKGNRSRRNDVLFEMWNRGYITLAERDAGYVSEIDITYFETADETRQEEGYHIYDWYIEGAISQVQDDLMEQYGWSRAYASLNVLTSGYKIYLPVDMEVQGVLEEVYINNPDTYFPSAGNSLLQPQSAIVIMDPYTGDVLGTVGRRGVKNVNRGSSLATDAKRPPGSSIKPVTVFAPALEEGLITYGTVLDDTPLYFDEEYDKKTYESLEAALEEDAVSYDPYPHNLPDTYQGLTTINRAIETSKNTIALKVLQMLGIDKSFDFAKNKLHINSLVESYSRSDGTIITDKALATLGLGQLSFGLTVLELTSAYCIFQNQGVYNSPNMYLYVTDSEDNLVLNNEANPEIVLSPETASIMTTMLENVVNYGTATSITLRQTVDVAGKTGTTTADFDRYFVGYTPYYVAGVWTGYEMNQTLSAFVKNPSVTIWDTVMTMLHQKYIDEAAQGGEALQTFEQAPGVIQATYCLDSGLLCSDACKLDPRGNRSSVGYFTRESVPKEYCDTHVIVLKDASTGLIAHDGCDPNNLYETALIRVEGRNYPKEIYIVDAQYAYMDLPDNVMPSQLKGLAFFFNMLGEERYPGSSYIEVPYNAWCVDHYDYEPWEELMKETETEDIEIDDALDGLESDGEIVDEDEYYDDDDPFGDFSE